MRLLPGSPALFTLILMSGALQTPAWAALNWQVGRGTWTGALGLRYAQTNTSAESSAGGASTASSRSTVESFFLNGTKLYVLDPRLVTINLGLSLDLNQFNLSSSAPDDSVSASGYSNQGLGYNLEAIFLREKPYNGRFYADRRQIDTQQSFGGRTTGVSDNVGLQLMLTEKSVLKDWGLPWFNASLALAQSKSSSTSRFLDNSYHFEGSQRMLNFAASKGFINADLSFNYSLAEAGSAEALQPSRRNHAIGLGYSHDFGPGLNRQFSSSLVYNTLGGGLPNNTLEADAKLHIDHYRNLSSSYTYEFNRQELGTAGAVDAVGVVGAPTSFVRSDHIGTATLSHQLYQNLGSSLAMNVNQSFVPNGSQTSYGGSAGQGYSHSLPGQGSLSLSWSGGYSHNTNALSSDSNKVDREVHIVAPADSPAIALPGFLLGKAFVIDSSIQVVSFNEQTGETVTLVPELPEGGVADYRIVKEGNFVRIEPVYDLGNDPNDPNYPWRPGRRLEVSYTYQLDANVTYETRDLGYGATVSYGWFGASYQHQQSQLTPLAGDLKFVSSTRDDTASVWLNLQGAWLGTQTAANARHTRHIASGLLGSLQDDTTSLSFQGSRRVREIDLMGAASFIRYRATLQDYDARNVSANMSWRPEQEGYGSYNWRLSLTAAANDIYYLTTARQSGTRNLRGRVQWNTPTGWQNSAYAAIKTRSDKVSPDQTAMELGANTGIQFGKLILNANASLVQFKSGGRTVNNQSFQIAVTRRFY